MLLPTGGDGASSFGVDGRTVFLVTTTEGKRCGEGGGCFPLSKLLLESTEAVCPGGFIRRNNFENGAMK